MEYYQELESNGATGDCVCFPELNKGDLNALQNHEQESLAATLPEKHII